MDILFLFLLVIALAAVVFHALSLASKSNARSAQLEVRLRQLENQLQQAQPAQKETSPSPAQPMVPPELPPPLTPRPMPSVRPKKDILPMPKAAVPSINWEQFMGVKLFAWLGGLALFLAVCFFIKYSFEHDFIPPGLRVTLGFLTGLGLIVGGVCLNRKDYKVTAQTICGTGVVILYAVAFACRVVYHFPFFGVIPTFLLMIAVTVAAFLLAVRLDAMVVAVLGMLGGFLTPMLLSTGEDHAAGLFAYVLLLDLGLLAVARRQRWDFLSLGAAAGTAFLQLIWLSSFFVMSKLPMAAVVFLVFDILFLLAIAWYRRTSGLNPWLEGSTAGLAFVTLGFTAYLILQDASALPLVWFLGLVWGADLCLLGLSSLSQRLRSLDLVAGLIVFLILALWTLRRVTPDLLPWALGAYLIFAALHTGFPLWKRRRMQEPSRAWTAHLFPSAAMLLLLLPVLNLPETSFVLWPAVLLVDLLAIFLAFFSASFATLLLVTFLTAVLAAAWLFRLPARAENLVESMVVICGFAILFMAASLFLARRFKTAFQAADNRGISTCAMPSWMRLPGDAQTQVPAFSACLPFLLLLILVERFSLPSPHAVFALALVLSIMLFVMARNFRLRWLPLIGLSFTAMIEGHWFAKNFADDRAIVPLAWFIMFFGVYAVQPFLRSNRNRLPEPGAVWAAAALSGPAHFCLVYRLILEAWPNDFMGLIPAGFAMVYGAALYGLARRHVKLDKAKHGLTELAWIGGVTLFFVTLIIPIQFERQWITVSWALEGAALLWLYHRVPHGGLQGTGLALLGIAFIRLALNPAVFSYQTRSGIPILNWYLYAYGLTAASLYAGAWLMRPPRHRIQGKDARPLLITLGTVLVFLLMNIEIADFFTEPEASSLTFQFSGNFARDMTYSIAWALFAFGLLVAGIRRQLASVRYASIGLLGVTLLKLFFHDLARLAQIYRIGALFGVAVIAILASLLYQKFLSNRRSDPRQGDEPAEP